VQDAPQLWYAAPMVLTVKTGDRIIVHGNTQPYAKAFVSNTYWDSIEHRWIIELDWECGGKSKVYGHDEGKVWYRYGDAN